MKIEDFVLQIIEHRNLKRRWLAVRDSQPLFDPELVTRHLFEHKLAPALVDPKDISLAQTEDGGYVVCERAHGLEFNQKIFSSFEKAVQEKVRQLIERLKRDLEWVDYIRANLSLTEFVQMFLRHGRDVDFPWQDYFGVELPYTREDIFRTVVDQKLERSLVDADWKGADGLHLVETSEGQLKLFETERGVTLEEEYFTDLHHAVMEKIDRQLSQIAAQMKSYFF